MKKLTLGLLIALISLMAKAGDSVEPASTNYTSIRGEAVSAIGGVYYQDTTLLFTNCICFSDQAGIVTQGLAEVTVDVSVGSTATNVDYVGTVYDINDDDDTNAFWVSITVPDFITGTVSVQTKLTNGSTNSYIYSWKTLSHKEAM